MSITVFRRLVTGIIQREMFRRPECTPLFKKALDDPKITAWVCASDPVGLLALDFLKSRGKQVPRQISVVSVDDCYDAFQAGLTSYNFNVPMLLSRTLDFIVRPEGYPGIAQKKREEIVGHLIERVSSGPLLPGPRVR